MWSNSPSLFTDGLRLISTHFNLPKYENCWEVDVKTGTKVVFMSVILRELFLCIESWRSSKLWLQSSLCHLRGLKPGQLVSVKEEALEMGGFVLLLWCAGHFQVQWSQLLFSCYSFYSSYWPQLLPESLSVVMDSDEFTKKTTKETEKSWPLLSVTIVTLSSWQRIGLCRFS